MKHIRYQFLALLSVSALTFTSCDLIGSIDDMEPDHVVTDLNYNTDAASAQTALNGVYASWRSTGVSYLRYGIASMAHTQTQAMVIRLRNRGRMWRILLRSCCDDAPQTALPSSQPVCLHTAESLRW